MKVSVVPALFACLLVGGCASNTLSKDECRTVDWRTIGYEDGVAGRSGEQIGRHRQACAEHGVTPDLDAYRTGRAEGLREFCQPRNGYRAGASGQAYYDSCPAELAPAFLEAYDQGRELYVRERRVADADAAIASRRYEIARLEDSLVRRGFRVADESATAQERTQAVVDAKQAGERIGRLKAEIVQLEKDRARYQQELDTYRTQVATR
jgi:ribosome modulation factor